MFENEFGETKEREPLQPACPEIGGRLPPAERAWFEARGHCYENGRYIGRYAGGEFIPYTQGHPAQP